MLVIRKEDNVVLYQIESKADIVFGQGFTSVNGLKVPYIKEKDVSVINYETVPDFKPFMYKLNTVDDTLEVSPFWYTLIEDRRKDRDVLLAETDWSAGSDVTMSDEMRTYRQALRDIPQQEGFPLSIIWPNKP